MKYDFLIVGCGLFGSVCARELSDRGYSCLIIDKRNHIGGNCYTKDIHNIHVHKYGPHIFHTDNEKIWKYVNQFADFDNFILNVIASYKDKFYSLPFNMWTFHQMWGVKNKDEAKKIIDSQRFIGTPSNLEEYALSKVGADIYYSFIYGYTKKQWQTEPKNLPVSIIKRLPIRFVFDNNYFNDKYQGIPRDGYTSLIKNMLDKCEILLGTDFFNNRSYFEGLAKYIIYTGPIDRFYDNCYGKLNYRSLFFEESQLPIDNYQGSCVINYTSENIPYTRIIEHKYFNQKPIDGTTVITKEYPIAYHDNAEPYYPIETKENIDILAKYQDISKKNSKIIFGGRLAEYRYYDMHQIIGSALTTVNKIINI